MFYIRPPHSPPCIILFQVAITLGDNELDAISCLSVHFKEHFQHQKSWDESLQRFIHCSFGMFGKFYRSGSKNDWESRSLLSKIPSPTIHLQNVDFYLLRVFFYFESEVFSNFQLQPLFLIKSCEMIYMFLMHFYYFLDIFNA